MLLNDPRRPSGMAGGLLKKFGVVAIAVALPGLMWLLTPAPDSRRAASQPTVSEQVANQQAVTHSGVPSAGPSPAATLRTASAISVPPAPSSETYALALPSLRGLPPDTPPGTPLKLWAAWEPPITRQPRIQVLIERVILKAIVPSTDPSAPPTALLWVPGAKISDLLYGDRYGALSVTLPEPTA